MKKIILLTAMTIISLMVIAQNNDSFTEEEMTTRDVTTFLGIPVDGRKDDVILELIMKGFAPKSTGDGMEFLQGQFNGQEVMILVVAYQKKVFRVYLQEKNTQSAGDIKMHYNNLVRQFENDQNYIKPDKDQTIPEDVNISDEMNGKERVFFAEFYQKNKAEGQNQHKKKVWFMIGKRDAEYFIATFYDNEYNMPEGDEQ